jgi:hypothetical protein
MTFMNPLGIMGTVLTVVSFGIDNMHLPPAPQGTRVQIKLGLGDDKSQGLVRYIKFTCDREVNN